MNTLVMNHFFPLDATDERTCSFAYTGHCSEGQVYEITWEHGRSGTWSPRHCTAHMEAARERYNSTGPDA